MYNSDHDEINDVGEGDGEGGEVGGAGGEGRDTATGIRTVSGDDDPSSDNHKHLPSEYIQYTYISLFAYFETTMMMMISIRRRQL